MNDELADREPGRGLGLAGGAMRRVTAVRGRVAPLIRAALALLPEGGDELNDLVASRLPEAMRSRLEPGEVAVAGRPPAAPGQSALLVISGPGIRAAQVAVVLHASGAAYSVALRAEGVGLPPELAGPGAGLDIAPPPLARADAAGREWVDASLATITRPALELEDDHRWWGDVGAMLMLAGLLE